ncbi:MAG: tRNA (adenosine(37)-N6)-dimethylallyltransferase MiaA, partial [Gammaproteobacteria bacterium]|nr:tRNA (adenosine(37)-N6)-dimethylallyltransferase MiaA [Gammaproteobacteria bacterium]
DGFVAEVESLYRRGDLTEKLPAIKSVGYRQVWRYLSGQSDYREMVEKSTIATRQLAKRQLTWMKTWDRLNSLTLCGVKARDHILNYVETVSI